MFNCGVKKSDNLLIFLCYLLIIITNYIIHKIFFVKNLNLNYIYLPNIRKKLYNKDNLSDLEKFILVMCEQDINLSKDLGKGNEIMEDFVDDAVYASNDEVLDIYDAEVIKQMEMQDMKRQGLSEGYDAGRNDGYDAGIEQGIEQGIETGERNKQLEIAKNMLNKNIDIETIISCTGLTKEEINNL